MKRNNIVKSAIALIMALVLTFALAACSGGEKKKEAEYKQQVADISTEVQKVFTNFSNTLPTLDPEDENSLSTIEGMIDEMETSFEKYGKLTAPKKYEPVQTLLNESTDMALKGLGIIREEIKGFFGSEGTGDTAKLQEGTQLLMDAALKLQEAGEKGDEIDSK
ncbi:DUF7018 domain-containing (lipo)protein [Zongyangia hominis]|uniref:DUF7018 domain-containing protein n=1 Tax=Zongyangia hominis TaxID=2763677 RepID=A0A926ED35_9FIRM|nr:hypothetical protein [Zongyangia hominis]MBC8569726.1 hypothetical protein [Zongyangia hominis]